MCLVRCEREKCLRRGAGENTEGGLTPFASGNRVLAPVTWLIPVPGLFLCR